MVKRLEHVRDCDGEDCKLTDREILEGLDFSYEEGAKASDEERGQYHDEEASREAFQYLPSIQVRSDWHDPGEKGEALEYELLLCTGGPAVRISGELGEHNEPSSARLEYQDWFTPWEKYITQGGDDDDALLTYARQFYFGE